MSINSGLDALAIILVWLFVPGTREIVSLEEFNYIFGVPTRRHIEYQMAEVLPWIVRDYIPWLVGRYLPWLIRYYVLRDGVKAGADPGEELPPLDGLYSWNSVRRMEVDLEMDWNRDGYEDRNGYVDGESNRGG